MQTFLITLGLIIFSFFSFGQDNDFSAIIMSYNVENLFDTDDNPITADDEFTISGMRHWTNYRLHEKLARIAKVIVAVGKWKFPDIVGLCEVENRKVLEMLVAQPTLRSAGYNIIHKESPDRRGIDVALIYRTRFVHPIEYNYIEVNDKEGNMVKTREILYFSCLIAHTDTLHIFFNHWPSRYGGLLETVDGRKNAAGTLKNKVDELYREHINPKIVITGDFNDQPSDESISEVLRTNEYLSAVQQNKLYNLSAFWKGNPVGTHKYQSQWSVFDQIIVSGSLLVYGDGIFCSKDDAHIFNPGFLLEKDTRYGGAKPKRTYVGYKYYGGVSDHLPVYLKINKR